MSSLPGNQPGNQMVRRTRTVSGPVARRQHPLTRRAGTLQTGEGIKPRLIRYGGTLAALSLATALLYPVRESIGLLNIGMVFLIVVVGATVLAGQTAGLFASVLGFALFNFFLVPPYLTFVIADLQNILALFVFLGVSTLISWLIADAREQAIQAQRRAEDVSRLYELSQAITGARHMDDVLPAIAGKVADVFQAQCCWILLPNGSGQLTVQAQAVADGRTLTRDEMALADWAFHHGSNVGQKDPGAPESTGIVFMPLRSGRGTIGVLGVADKIGPMPFTVAERTVLATFADQAAVAIERLYLLREAERAEVLARTDELKSALMLTVSHDLRTPLASIMASVTSLLEPGMEWDTETRQDFLLAIYEEARRLDRLVGNLLQMSRIEAGALRPEKEWYAIGEVIEAVLQRLEATLSGRPVTTDIEGDLPLVLLDFTEIDQVITNLLENAAKYTPPGTPVSIEAHRAGDTIEVSVSDQGDGVPTDHLANLFSKFYRVDGHKQIKGMGLGLAISRGLVEAHGGRIWARNLQQGGLKVTFTLPVSPDSKGAALEEPAILTASGSDA